MPVVPLASATERICHEPIACHLPSTSAGLPSRSDRDLCPSRRILKLTCNPLSYLNNADFLTRPLINDSDAYSSQQDNHRGTSHHTRVC